MRSRPVRAQATYTACYIHVARLGLVVVFIVSHIILKATFKVVVIALLLSLLLNIGAGNEVEFALV